MLFASFTDPLMTQYIQAAKIQPSDTTPAVFPATAPMQTGTSNTTTTSAAKIQYPISARGVYIRVATRDLRPNHCCHSRAAHATASPLAKA